MLYSTTQSIPPMWRRWPCVTYMAFPLKTFMANHCMGNHKKALAPDSLALSFSFAATGINV